MMEKLMTDVIKNQNEISAVLKRLEDQIKNIHFHLDKIEITINKTLVEANSLIHMMKDELADNIMLIDKKNSNFK